jgi:anti-sigma-K factor RskA
MRAIALNSSEVAPQVSGFVIIGADGRNGALVVDKFPPLAADQSYQVWLIRDGQYSSGGLFTVDESGYRGARITAPHSLLDYSAIQITIEPAEGSPHPTGALLMDGSLHNQ